MDKLKFLLYCDIVISKNKAIIPCQFGCNIVKLIVGEWEHIPYQFGCNTVKLIVEGVTLRVPNLMLSNLYIRTYDIVKSKTES